MIENKLALQVTVNAVADVLQASNDPRATKAMRQLFAVDERAQQLFSLMALFQNAGPEKALERLRELAGN